jgi:aspartate racemase
MGAGSARAGVTILGIVGGIAPGSTIDYYRMLVAAYRAARPDGSYPAIVINSIDMTRMLGMIGGDRLPEVTEYLLDEIARLARAGADVGLLASNTPHIVFDQLAVRSPIPLLSIVEAAGAAAQAMGVRSVGLLGTRFTMEASFYPDAFARRGIAVHSPPPGDRAYVHAKYMGELVAGEFRDETRARFLEIIGRLQDQAGVEAVVLAGTELPLLLREDAESSVPLLDTTRIHVAQAVASLLAGDA